MSASTEIGPMLAGQLDRLFDRHVTRTLLSGLDEGRPAHEIEGELEGLGVADALVPEEAGGAGLGWSGVEPVFRCLGYHAAPTPLGETIIGRWALAAAGLPLPPGPLALVADPLPLSASNDFEGAAPLVQWAPFVEHAVIVADRDGERFVCLASLKAVRSVTAQARNATIARIPASFIHFEPVPAHRIAAAPPPLQALGLLPALAVLRSAQMAGGLDRLLDLAVDYANTRTQFGKPIGKFQAIQHMIAELAEVAAAARIAAGIGCRALDKDLTETDLIETGPAVAKCRAGRSAGRGAAIAHQVFGAIGVTDEHVLHFLTRRLWQWREEGGSEFWWSERLGRRAIAGGGRNLWSDLTAGG